MHVASKLSDPDNQDEAMDTGVTVESSENVENGEETVTEEEDQVELSEDEIEYLALDRQLDDLNRALDALEQKNDNIHAQLKVLLETNREIKNSFEVENQAQK